MEKGVYKNLDEILNAVEGLEFRKQPEESMDQLLLVLNQIGGKAKKIGDAQRFYFQLAFRELFLPDAAQYRDLSGAWTSAQEKYEMLYT